MKKQFFILALFAAAWLAGGSTKAWDKPSQDANGVYQIGTASELEWFSEFVAGNSNGETAAVLTADLDFTGVTHTPIGPNKDAKFNGSFDGQYHHIKNLVINTTDNYQGIFGWVRGGSTIKNFTIDATCSFTGGDRTAAVVATLNNNGGKDSPMQILNIVNHANVNSASGAVSAFIGASDNTVFFKIHNCVNTGNIKTTGTGKYAVVANGWSSGNPGENSQVWNVVNTGTISPIDGTNTFFRGNYRSVQNSFDAVTTVYQSGVSAISAEDIANGRLCYLLNQGETKGISFKQQIGVDPYPMPVADGSVVYQVADLDCAGNPKGGVIYSNTDGGSRDPHNFVNGICSVCNGNQEPNLVDGWYELTNAGNVEWISEFVAGEHGGNIYPKVKMMNDIDFTDVSHTPIGNSSEKKFNGIFDGQGHRITNMVVNLPEQECVGLIGWARGPLSDGGNNTTIQNLIIDKTCSFTGKGRVAAFIGRGEVSNDNNSIVYITNCVNEANVTANTGTCAAFVGTHNADDNSPRIWISGCANHGNITAGPSDYAAAFIGWYKNNGKDGGNSTIENSYNTGVVSPKDGGTILFRGSYRTITNTYDLKNSENTQGTPFRGTDGWSTADPVASGELAYYINQQAGKQVFYQTFGTDAYPVPFNTHGIVNYISAAGYTTQYIPTTDVEIPSDVEAFAGVINGSSIKLVAIEGDAISKDDAVVLKGSEGYYSFVPTTGATQTANNDLKGSDGNVTSDGSTIFALSNKANGVGFYPVGDGVKIPAGKAYLEYTGSNPVKGFTFVFDEDATGISLMEDGRSQMEDGAIYNIAGQRLDNSQFTIHNSQLKRGIYIVNGKKILK